MDPTTRSRMIAMIGAYGLAVAAACFSAVFVGLFTLGIPFSVEGESFRIFRIIFAMVVATLLDGTLAVPIVFFIGLPAYFCAAYAVVKWGIFSKWWWIGIGLLLALPAVFLFPVTNLTGGVVAVGLRGILENWILLVPSGALAGWVFWRVGVAPTWVRKDHLETPA